MRHLGDITKINGAEAPVVDCIIGGSPCQDLSIAGKRAGLAGERSGLYMDQIRIIKEMRANARENGRTDEFIRPRYMVWENVPGAFSSNGGKDFAAVLEEAVRVIEPEAPPVPVPEKGWPASGCLLGDKWSVAWRVLDAQFWGVPQRRRRIALVADFGGQSAPEILFVRKSLSGNPEPSGKEGKGPATGAEKSVAGASYAVRIRGGCDGGGKGALVQNEKSGTLGCNNDQTIFYAIGSYHSNAWKSDNPNSGVYETDVAKTLDAINCGYPGCNQGETAVVASFKASNGAKARGIGYAIEQAPMLGAKAPVPAILDISHRDDVVREYSGVVPSLCARAGTGGNNVPVVMAFDTTQITSPENGRVPEYGKPCHTINANAHVPAIVYGIGNGQANQSMTKEVAGTLNTMHDQQAVLVTAGQYGQYKHGCGTPRAAGGDLGGGSENLVVKKRVRRLTPLECERLQGFPDGWTEGGTDSKRYKALGNSIALPPWKWVLKRLCAQYERDATMASLFDGIGGFPLIWEQLNGKGSCLWASEIEEFPIEVTKRRFGGIDNATD